MHNQNDIEEYLENNAPTLSQTERTVLWTELEKKLGAQAPIPSPFMFNFIHTKAMASLLLVLMLVIGSGGTALASDAARPGDLLFPVERALENARLKLAMSDDSRNELRTRFTDERLSELREILEEESEDVSLDSVVTTLNTASSSTSTSPVTEQKIRGKKLKENGEARVGVAVHEILSFLDDTKMSNDERVRVLEKIFGEMDTLALDVRVDDNNTREDVGDDHIEIRRDDKGESRIEIRDGNERMRIEEKDGEIRVRTRTDDSVSSHVEERSTPVSTESSSTAPIDYSFEVEADVFTDTTIIKVEWNDEITFLETTARTREDVITEILKAFDVNRATVLNALDFEIENRASRPEDSQVANDTIRVDEEDDSWEDEDEDDDRDERDSDDDRDERDSDDDRDEREDD